MVSTIPAAHSVDGQAAVRDLEVRDWIESLRDVLQLRGADQVERILRELQIHAQKNGVALPVNVQTPYVNTIAPEEQPPYPGDLEQERAIRRVLRWTAMATVVEANRKYDGIGGHISTYASAATLYEVGFNHFFRGNEHPCGGDLVYFQGHSSPGIYSRAFLEGRISTHELQNFRRELAEGGGLPSYPHPWLKPDFWQFPTVSMGLGPIMSIYQARFMRYLEDRGLKEPTDANVWAFLGDGESDSPEALGAVTLASREKLDNLIWVVNCNLQRLDGPVRGNGNIIQELEAIFRGAGWNVIKVIWGSDWDPLYAKDHDGLLAKRAGEVIDGEYQKYIVAGGGYIREHFYGVDERLLEMVADKTDDELWFMRLGGHDSLKVHAAYSAAVNHKDSPTVILARTIKGYGLGEAGEGRNITHQQKKLNEDELHIFRDRFKIPLSNEEIATAPLYRPDDASPEMKYLHERRSALGGYVPFRRPDAPSIGAFDDTALDEFYAGTGDRTASTTMAFVRVLSKLLRDPVIGDLIVPIVPDEARTFGMEALFRQVGIYSRVGQLYQPVDSDSLLYYKESTDGQILEEGITEAGSASSFIAAGTAYANYGLHTIPFYIYYSMFGYQRVGDLLWAAADSRARGFLIGATAGRTTLSGEGLQHEDGHSHVLFSVVPTCKSYDPAFAYEIAVIVREGIRRMYEQGEDIYYYLTVTNESYLHPAMPDGPDVRDGILKGMYRFRSSEGTGGGPRAQLLGSGAILNEVIEAQHLLRERFGVAADVWSVTSYNELRRQALEIERWNLLHPGEPARMPYVTECLSGNSGVVVASSDYMKSLPDSIAKWVPGHMMSLGTDGFGRSDTREGLRDFFEVDARYVTLAALSALARKGEIGFEVVKKALEELDIDPLKPNPFHV